VTPENLDLIAGWASLVLTLMVFSYLLGDNVLYRVAVHILVGVAASYIAIIAIESVLVPWLDSTTFSAQGDRDNATWQAVRVVGTVPFLFGILLLLKFSARLAPVGNLGLAFMIGVGTAVALVGAVGGTIVPLVRKTGDALGDDALDGLVIVGGTLATLLYFQYFAVEREGELTRPRPLQWASRVGQFFISLALGAIYAGAIVSSLTIFSDVIDTQLRFILDKMGG
jgi:hypothetical protein